MKRFLCLFTINFIVILSCTTTNVITPNNSSTRINLKNTDIIFLALPKDGGYRNDIVTGSGKTTLSKLQYVLEDYALKIFVGSTYELIEACKTTAKEKGAKYLFFPTIANWEDRATAWSGLPDKVEIKMVIYDLENDQIIYSVQLNSQSKRLTMGTTDPSELLLGLFQEFAQQIY